MEEGNSSLQSLLPSKGRGSGENLAKGDRRREIKQEVKKQLWLAGPLIGVSVLQYCLQVISIMFVGHLGELALSSASLATSFANVTGFSLLVCGSLVCLQNSLFLAFQFLEESISVTCLE